MARMIPSSPVPGAPTSEVATFRALSQLDDDWVVIHSVRWQAVRGRRQGDGEADFLLIHPKHGIVVLEVKGGEIRIEQGVWFTTSRSGFTEAIKNPFEQAVASKHALHRFLRETFPRGDRIPVCHAVVFPDIEVNEPLGPDAPTVLILDSRKLKDIRRAARGVIQHWGMQCNLGAHLINSLIARLRPTIEIRRVLRDDVRESREELLKLTAQQIRVLGGMRRNRRARIVGGAGTGKTILAREKACEYGSQGLRTLLTCFNEPLAESSARALKEQPNVIVRHFHSLCLGMMRDAGIQPPAPIPEEWWTTKAAEALLDAIDRTKQRFDAIVVDEGQDFIADWITALLMALTSQDDSPFFVFLDSHQDIYVRGCSYPEDWPVYELTTNCRNTLPIAERVAAIYGDPVDSLGANGPEPVVEFVKTEAELLTRLESNVEELLERERVEPGDLTVLCGTRSLVEQLRSMVVCDYVFCPLGRRGIVAETVWRFKGLESPVVVLALPTMPRLAPETARALAYVGLSRANAGLFVIATSEWRTVLGDVRRQ